MVRVVKTETPLCPYDRATKCFFDFTEFEMLGRGFVTAFARAFVLSCASVARATARTRYSAARDFLRWIVKNERELARLTVALRADYTNASAIDWDNAYELWKDVIINEPRHKPATRYMNAKCLCIVLRNMIAHGVIPKFTVLPPPLKIKGIGNPKKTLAELSQQDDYKETNNNSIGTSCVRVADKTDDERASELLKLNAERLATVRACASKDFVRWRDHWSEGQRLLDSCDMSFAEIDGLTNTRSNSIVKSKVLRTLFPVDNRETTLSRLLFYLVSHPENRRQMIGPPASAFYWLKPIVRRCGGINEIWAYLYPHVEMTTAAIIIFLCDTGANVSVARTLPCDCLADGSEPNYKVIKGVKMRSGGKLIVNELPVKDPAHEISCVEVIQNYRQITERVRSLALKGTEQKLFLCADRVVPVRPITGSVLTANFKRFCKRHPELRGLEIHPTTIRPSVLLQAATDKEGGFIQAAAIGDHSFLSTTAGYVSRFPSRILWERRIREFQVLFQAVSVYTIQDAAKKLGLTTDEIEMLFNKARRTGLGSLCLDPTGGGQPGSTKGQICTQLHCCPTCQNVIVIATEENLTDLIVWNRHLEESRLDWEVNRPERWERVWLPWLVFTQVAIEQASRGRTVGTFMKAKALAESLIANGQINLPPIW